MEDMLSPWLSVILSEFTSVGRSMTTGLDGLLDIRQIKDMLNTMH